MQQENLKHHRTLGRMIMTATLIGLYLTTFVNYLLFHSLVELFSIVVASCLFVIVWNSRSFIENQYLLFIGIAYLFIAFLDLLHTLSYKGMPIFADYDFYANQLWIGARFMESLSLLIGFLFLRAEKKIKTDWVFLTYAFVTGALIASIFYWKIFPECFIAGSGLTAFKKNSEYVICIILMLNVYLLCKNRAKFEPQVFQFILWSFFCTIISELAFTFYVSNYGFSNLVGHYFKLFSFYLIYLAIIVTCVKSPYRLIFWELDLANKKLQREIENRKKSEQLREQLIADLRRALEEIKTLRGIIPICASCKKIRDDKGFWNQIESYIRDHSEAEFSHGICPECAKKLYPNDED